ncbi:MAG TPA: glycosyltransferase family 39 protein [Opitutaceae bacterium]|jgi:4-amino-4-deoxy-L-arabinose transferase-like glycosyltransferase|nr:glycosyltransferase family 39 protein [Opitutaceae bacterium]
MDRPERNARWIPAVLFLGTAALYLFRLGQAGLYDLDEAVYAEIAREMLALRDWLTPHLDFVPYLEKPPLHYWLTALSIQAGGATAFFARLPAALAAAAAAAFTADLGRRLWGPRAGWAAGAILATSFGCYIFGRMAMPDMLFAALVTAAFWGYGRALLEADAPGGCALVGAAAMGAAVMAKGLIGLIFPALVIGLFLLWIRDGRGLRRLRLFSGALVFLLVAVPWHGAMSAEHPGFFRFYVVNEHLKRFLGHRALVNYHTLPIPTFLALTLVWFCPWSVFLPAALVRFRLRRADPAFLFVALWAAAVIGFFVLSASRLEYYGLPALPALALIVGRLWADEIGRSDGRSRAMAWTWIALGAFAACLVPAALLFPRLEHLTFYNLFPQAQPAESIPATALARAQVDAVPGFGVLVPLLETVVILIIAGVAAAGWAWRRGRPARSFAGLLLTLVIGLAVVGRGFALFEPYGSVARLAAIVRAEAPAGAAVILEGRYERHAGLGFYTARPIALYHGSDGVLAFGTRYGAPPPGTFLADGDFAGIWQGPAPAYFVSDAPDCLARTRALDPGTVILGRTGPTWLLAHRPPPETLAPPRDRN